MSANIEDLVRVSDSNDINWSYVSDSATNAIEINGLYFVDATTPFNSESVSSLIKDKYFVYEKLNELIHMPKTYSFLDPNVSESYNSFLKYRTYEEIGFFLDSKISYPVIVKPNKGNSSRNVFVAKNLKDIIDAMKEIFSRVEHYDYIALVQEYIPPKRELRAMVFKNNLEIVYEKTKLHQTIAAYANQWSEGVSNPVSDDDSVTEKAQILVNNCMQKIDLGWVALDIIEDIKGGLWLLELNTRPGFKALRRNSEGYGRLDKLWEKVVKSVV